MAPHRRPSIEDREAWVDLFDDPPWRPDDDEGTTLAWLRHLGFVLFLTFLGLLGAGLVIAAIAFIAFFADFKLNFGSLNFNITPPAPSANGIDIALSADGSRAYVTEPSDNRLIVLDTHSRTVLATVTVGDTPSGLAVSPDGAQVWVVNTDLDQNSSGGTVSVVSTTTDSVIGTIPGSGPGPIDVAFSPDGTRAYVSNNGVIASGSVDVIDTTTLAVVETLAPTIAGQPGSPAWNPTSVAVSADGRQLWVSAVNDLGQSTATADVIDVFDTATGAQLAEIPVGSGPFFMILSRDGREAYVADKESCDLREIDTATLAVTATVQWPPADGCPFGLADGPNDDVVYTVTGNDHSFNQGQKGNVFGAVDFRTSEIFGRGHVGSDPVTLAMSPSGWAAYVVDADRPLVDMVDPATGVTVATFALPTS